MGPEMTPSVPQRRRTDPHRVKRAIVGALRKPLVGATPQPRREFATYVLVAAASISYLAFIASRSHDVPLLLVVALSAIIFVAGIVTISFGQNQLDTDCSDVFLAIAIVGLGATSGGALVGLLVCLSVALFRAASWQGAIGLACFFGSFAAVAVLIEQGAARLDLTYGWHCGLAIAAMFFAWRLLEIGFHAVDVWSAPGEGQWDGGLWSKVWHDHGESILESMTWLATFAPTAILGAIAFELHPATILLVAAPYTVAWNNTRHAARLAHAEHRMGTDELTGLANRAKMLERAQEEMQHAEQYGHELVLALGDLDDFKRINDTMGHLIGDEVLSRTAEAIRKSIDNRSCMAARYGGEEFVLLLPASELDAAHEIVERIRETIKSDLEQYGTTISFGIARREPGDTFAALMHRADEAMYTSKLAGKNRTTTWTTAIVEITDHAWGIDGRDAFGRLPDAGADADAA